MAGGVKVRIGIQGARELELDIDDAEATRTAIEQAVGDGVGVIWLTDSKGIHYGLVTEKLAFVQIDDASDRSGVGFGP